jgi:group I intron endonuclease
MSYGIIYKATDPTGKVYIGQTTESLSLRKSKHAYRVKKMDHRGAFQIALLEHGFSTFSWEQIDTAESKKELDTKEKKWIAHYRADDPTFGYNATDGGTNTRLSPETKRKISEAKKGKPHNNQVGDKHPRSKLTEETVRQIKIELQAGMKSRDVKKKHGVTKFDMYNIKSGKSWKWLQVATNT